MTKSMILEHLGFYLARVLILQAGYGAWKDGAWKDGAWKDEAWKPAQNLSLISVDAKNRQQSLSIDTRGESDRPLF